MTKVDGELSKRVVLAAKETASVRHFVLVTALGTGKVCYRQYGVVYVMWYGMVRYSMVRYGMVSYCMVLCFGMIWYGMVWHGMLLYCWYGVVRSGGVWYGTYGLI